jgi:iron complex transport system substrate-binding protein
MNRRRWFAALALAAILVLGPLDARAAGFVLRDDLEREVAFSSYPQRIISLLPSLTETVCALGACARLVATDQFSNWPAAVQELPKVGGLDEPEIESMVSLRPDLVLVSSSQRITDRLRELGIASFALKTERFPDIERGVSTLGAILGLRAEAAALNERISTAVRGVSTGRAARHGAPPTVYFEVDRGPYAAGPESFIGQLLALLGARNIVTGDLGPFPKLNPEFVVRMNPDVIFTTPADASTLAERPGWDRIRAVRERRLCYFPSAVQDTIVRPGPRVADGMRALADCLDRVSP